MQLLVRWTFIGGLSGRLEVSTASQELNPGTKDFVCSSCTRGKSLVSIPVYTQRDRESIVERKSTWARSVRMPGEGGPGKYSRYYHTICNNRNGYYRYNGYYLVNPAPYCAREPEWRRSVMQRRNKCDLPRSWIVVTVMVNTACVPIFTACTENL